MLDFDNNTKQIVVEAVTEPAGMPPNKYNVELTSNGLPQGSIITYAAGLFSSIENDAKYFNFNHILIVFKGEPPFTYP